MLQLWLPTGGHFEYVVGYYCVYYYFDILGQQKKCIYVRKKKNTVYIYKIWLKTTVELCRHIYLFSNSYHYLVWF